MMTRIVLAALAATAFTVPAQAVTFVTEPGSMASYIGPVGAARVDFDSPTPATISVSGGTVVTGDLLNEYAEPGFATPAGTRYLAVRANETATVQSTIGYSTLSLFLGSIDAYNTISLLDTAGNVIQSFTGSAFTANPNGDQEAANTNRRVTFSSSGDDALLGGLRFTSGANALETDNIVFAPVPEPATWAMMLLGFGLVGFATRARRRNAVTTVFA